MFICFYFQQTIPTETSAEKLHQYYLTDQTMSLTPEDNDDMIVKDIIGSVPIVEKLAVDTKNSKAQKDDGNYWVQQ